MVIVSLTAANHSHRGHNAPPHRLAAIGCGQVGKKPLFSTNFSVKYGLIAGHADDAKPLFRLIRRVLPPAGAAAALRRIAPRRAF